MSEAYGKLPLSFEANRGQTDPQVKFLSRGPRQTPFLASTEAVLALTEQEPPIRESAAHNTPAQRGPTTKTVLRMTFAGANPAAYVTGLEKLPGKANYFIGNDPAKWRTNVPTYARVHYHDLYPGIDLIYYGIHGQIEYDFVVRPGADPTRIVLAFHGADRLEVDAQGNLVLHTAAGPIRQRKPVIYQEVGGVRKEISGGYVLAAMHQVRFRVAAYDARQPLVIDPTLVYSTYLGGSAATSSAGGFDFGAGIAVDALGNAYVTGRTSSTNFPTTAGAFQPTFSGRAFVVKITECGRPASTPAEQIADLETLIRGFGLPHDIENSLLAKLRAAEASLAHGNTTAACNELQALISEARAQSGKQLTPAQATAIITAAQAIRTALGCH